MKALPEGVSHDRFPALDGYRAIAAFMVLGTHVAFMTGEINRGVIGKIFARFDFGVPIFFLLSGFLLYGQFSRAALSGRNGPQTGTFYWRRFMRIVPAYLVMCVVVLLTFPNLVTTPTQWITNLTLTHVYVPHALVSPLGQTWSLAIEVSFYAVLPIIAWLATRRHKGDITNSFRRQLLVLLALGAIGVLYQATICFSSFAQETLANLWLPAYLDWFALGMLAALLQGARSLGLNNRLTRAWDMTSREVATCLVIGISLFAIAATPLSGTYALDPTPGINRFAKHILYGLSALFLVLPGFRGPVEGRWLRGLSSPFLAWVGTVSYGVFLWHLYVGGWIMELLNMQLFGGGFWILLPLTAAGSLLFGWISWIVIEKPLAALSHRRKRPSASSANAPKTPAPASVL